MKRARADAWQRLAGAHALIAGDDARAADALQHCWQKLDEAGDAAGRLCAAAAMCEYLHVQRRDFRDYERWRARLAAELAAGSAESLPARGTAQELRALIGIAWAAQIKPFAGWGSVDVAQRIDRLLESAGGGDGIDADLHLHAAAAAIRAYGHQDHMAGIEATIARATPHCAAAGVVARVAWLQAAGTALAFSMPDARGLQLLADARELAARHRLHAALFELCHDEIFLRLGRDGAAGLEPLFEQLAQALDPTRLYDVARRHHLSARRSLLDAADSGPALYYAQAAVELVEGSGYPVHDAAMLYVTLAYVCARRGDVPAALAAVEKMAAQASGSQQRQRQSLALFLRAYAMLLNEPLPQAAALLQQAFAEAERLQWFGFRPVPEVAARLVDAALRLDIEAAPYARKLIALRKLAPPGYSAAWPWAVRVVTLGRFQLRIRDTLLAADGKLPRKTLELLQYVAGSPALAVSADRLTASLWPELEGDMARGAFRTALHRCASCWATPTLWSSTAPACGWIRRGCGWTRWPSTGWSMRSNTSCSAARACVRASTAGKHWRSTAATSSPISRRRPGCWDRSSVCAAASAASPPRWENTSSAAANRCRPARCTRRPSNSIRWTRSAHAG